jgi:hypothetical protein
MTDKTLKTLTSREADRAVIDAFLAKHRGLEARQAPRGRLIFAMDATMSRQPTWDLAIGLQSEMFRVVKDIGGLDVQLVFFRGMDETRASKWTQDPNQLARMMSKVTCQGGYTQIRKVLRHIRQEAKQRRVSAVVYVGDCMEEKVDDLCAYAADLGARKVPVFLFQEGHDTTAESAFKEIARLSRGAYCRFDAGSAEQLHAFLTAVAVYAAGGHKALQATESKAAVLLLGQLAVR